MQVTQESQGTQGTDGAVMMNDLRVRDFAGQNLYRVSSVSLDSTVGEMVSQLVSKLPFPKNEPTGRPLLYRARLERESRHLDPNELVGDALCEEDEIVLHPTVNAG